MPLVGLLDLVQRTRRPRHAVGQVVDAQRVRPLRVSAVAWVAATIFAGFGKSGSPAPKPITGRPAAFGGFAFASVAGVGMPPILLDP
jgi:hypothetical protein